MRLSQSDLSSYLGVAQATLSQATSNGHRCKGHQVRAWAVYDGAGRVAGYDVPTHVMQQAADADAADADATGFGASLVDQIPQSIDQHRANPLPSGETVDASTSVSLLPQGEDYFRPASSGGAAYVMGKAIEADNRTSRGSVMLAGLTIGGLTGWEISGKHPAGGFAGAVLGCLAVWIGFDSVQADAVPRSEPGGVGGHSPRSLPRQRVQGRGTASLPAVRTTGST